MAASGRGWTLWGALAVLVVAAGTALVIVLSSSEEAIVLTQKPGRAGCVSETGSGGLCARGSALRLPVETVVSPDGRQAYVASMSAVAGGVAVFDRAVGSGALTQKRGRAGCLSDAGRVPACTRTSAIKAPVDLAVSPDGRNVYVAALTSDAIAILDRHAATGELRQRRGRAGCVGTRAPCARVRGMDAPLSVTVSPDGDSVYAYSYGSRAIVAFDRDPRSGALTHRPGLMGCSREGLGLTTCDSELVRFDQGLTVSADGEHAYETSADGLSAYDRDPDERTTRLKPGAHGCYVQAEKDDCTSADGLQGAADVALSPDGRSAYVTSTDSATLAIFDRDAGSGELMPTGCVSDSGTEGRCATGRGFPDSYLAEYSVIVSPDDRNVYVTTGIAVAVFDRRR